MNMSVIRPPDIVSRSLPLGSTAKHSAQVVIPTLGLNDFRGIGRLVVFASVRAALLVTLRRRGH
jgi:hypothetical protein